MNRRLVAILAADVVGYSALMAADHDGTLAALREMRAEIFGPTVATYRGKVVKSMGDGWLVEFASTADAVACAAKLQDQLAGNETMRLRIGIHLGDITHEDEDVYGDGVNVASRLEALAAPGSVIVSDAVHGSLDGKLRSSFEDMGARRLKNIDREVRVWRWISDNAMRNVDTTGRQPLTLPDKPSLAVLPFINMSDDPEQEFFADGITEDIITELSRCRSLFVIARNSSFTLKGRAVDVTEVGRTLGVRYVIEGSVRKSGNRVRVTVQLVEAESGKHVWAERYDRSLEDIFAIQDEVTETVVAAIEPELGAFERDRALRKPPDTLDAWETYQRGLWHMWSFTKEDNEKALPLLRRARELDPNFASAYAYEGYSHFLNVMLGYTATPGESITAGLDAAKKAVSLDDKDPAAYLTIGRLQTMLGEHDAAITALEKALRLNPSFAPAHFGLGFPLALTGRLDEALDATYNAERLNPRDPLSWAVRSLRSLIFSLQGRFEAGVDSAQLSLREPRAAGYWPHAVLASALGNLGSIEEASDAVNQALQQKPDLSLSYLERTLPTKPPGGLKPYLDGLRAAGLPE